MIRRSTWIFIIIFVVLTAVASYWERSGNQVEVTPTATPRISLLDLNVSSVTRLEILDNQGASLALSKDDAGNWIIEEPVGEIDTSIDLSSKIESFITVRALSALDSPPPGDASGLYGGAYTITLSLSGDDQRTVVVGSETVTGSGYYVQVNDTVFVVDKFTIENLVDLLQNPPYITPEATETPEGSPQTGTATQEP